MKRLFIAAILLLVGFCSLAKEVKHPLMASDTVVWVGLDYSLVRMIGTNEFNGTNAIFPGILERWNRLFIDERIEKVKSALGKRVSVDIGGVMERNKTAGPNQIIQTPGSMDLIQQSHITQPDIAAEVKSYKLDKTNGLGLVFIVDRLVYQYCQAPASLGPRSITDKVEQSAGAVYIVFFDVATREVISAQREIQQASGSGFRNFWFGVIKGTDLKLSKYR
jgi:hypothetical protein